VNERASSEPHRLEQPASDFYDDLRVFAKVCEEVVGLSQFVAD
jgi:hypothetical protein